MVVGLIRQSFETTLHWPSGLISRTASVFYEIRFIRNLVRWIESCRR